MVIASGQCEVVLAASATGLRSSRVAAGILLAFVLACVLSIAAVPNTARAAEPSSSDAEIERRVQALTPEIEAYIGTGMKAFDVPGLAIGIIANDGLIYSKGFGVRSKSGGELVDARTVFQIGSTTKGFLAATMALMVDRGKLHWDDRVVDLDPDFQFKDPWVTREFRVLDLLAQRSGLPPYVNDALGSFGFDEAALIRSLRHVEPVSSFRTTFAYTNITHLLAGRIVAKAANATDWNAVLRQELLEPLGMTHSTYTAAGIEASANHASGHRWAPQGTTEVPLDEIFPYVYGGAGDINSSIEDVERWVRMQLGNGTFEGRRIISPESLAFTRRPKVAITDQISYAMGWMINQTPNGTIVWHNGGTPGFGAYIGLAPEKNVGVIVLTNGMNAGLPDAIGLWSLDRILNNPKVDIVAQTLKVATSRLEKEAAVFAPPPNPRAGPAPASLVGSYANASFGKAAVVQRAGALSLEFESSGARRTLAPWNGAVFTAKLVPQGRFVALAEDSGPIPQGLVEFQIDKEAKLNVLRLSFGDGQAYDFKRE